MSAFDWIKKERDDLSSVLRGEAVNGVKMGDPGITREWLDEQIAIRDEMLDRIESDGDHHMEDAATAASLYPEDDTLDAQTGMTADERDWIG